MTRITRNIPADCCCDSWKKGIRTINGQYPDDNREFGIMAGKNVTIDAITAGIKINSLITAMIYKGTVGTGGTIATLPDADTDNQGWVYIAVSAATTPVTYQIGDMLISNGMNWDVVPSGDDILPIVTSWQPTPDDAHVPSEKLVKDSLDNINIGVSSVSAGVGLATSDGNPITSTGTIKAKLKSESNATHDAGGITNTTGRQYAVVPDKTNGYLSVNVPWEDTSCRQEISYSNKNYPLILSAYENTSPISGSGIVFRNNSIYANPSTGIITATGFAGAIGSTTNNIGDDSHPVKLVNGVLTPIGTPIMGATPAAISGITVNTGVLNTGDIHLYSATQWGNLVHLRGYVNTTVAAGLYNNVLLGIPTPADNAESYIWINASTEMKAIGRIGATASGIYLDMLQNISVLGNFDIWYLTTQ